MKIKKLFEQISISSQHTILDIGSSHGGFIEYFIRFTKNITGIEIDKEKIKNLKIKYPNINLICGNAFDESLLNELHNKQFDVITIDITTEPHGTIELIKKYIPFLKHDGIMLVAFKKKCKDLIQYLEELKYLGIVVKDIIQLDDKKNECHVFI